MKKLYLLLLAVICSVGMNWAAEASLPAGTTLFFCMKNGQTDWTIADATFIINFFENETCQKASAVKIGNSAYYYALVPAEMNASSFQILRMNADGSVQHNYSAAQSAISRESNAQNCLSIPETRGEWNNSQLAWSVYNPFELQSNWDNNWEHWNTLENESSSINTYSVTFRLNAGSNYQFVLRERDNQNNWIKYNTNNVEKTSSSNITLSQWSDAQYPNITFSLTEKCDVTISLTYRPGQNMLLHVEATPVEEGPITATPATCGGGDDDYIYSFSNDAEGQVVLTVTLRNALTGLVANIYPTAGGNPIAAASNTGDRILTFNLGAFSDGTQLSYRTYFAYAGGGLLQKYGMNFTVGTSCEVPTLPDEPEEPEEPQAPDFCESLIGHMLAENADPNSFVLLSIGSDGEGQTIVNIKQATEKNSVLFDYLQVNGLTSIGRDLNAAFGGVEELGVSFNTPAPDENGNITLEILWSTVNWDGRWMVQNIKVPANATCKAAVVTEAPTRAYNLTVTDAGWASMSLPFAVEIPAGVTAYYASNANANAVTLKEIEETVIPANTGVVLEASAGSYRLVEASTTTTYENLFSGSSNGAINVEASSVYVLSAESTPADVVFGLYTGTNMPAYKAYLPVSAIPATAAGAPARISFVFNESTIATDIESVEANGAVKFFENGTLYIQKNGRVYNVAGMIVK